MIDPTSLMLAFISVLGVIEVAGLIYSARKYRQVTKEIPEMCKKAAVEMLNDPKIFEQLFNAVGKGIFANMKAQWFGAMGGDAKARKHFEGEVTSAVLAEQGIDLSALAELIPEGSKLRPIFDKMQKNPELLPQFFQIAQKLYSTFKQYQMGNQGALVP